MHERLPAGGNSRDQVAVGGQQPRRGLQVEQQQVGEFEREHEVPSGPEDLCDADLEDGRQPVEHVVDCLGHLEQRPAEISLAGDALVRPCQHVAHVT